MKITFANDYTTPAGRTYKVGSTHEVNNDDARNLIFRGKARLAEESPAPAEPETSAAAESTPKKG